MFSDCSIVKEEFNKFKYFQYNVTLANVTVIILFTGSDYSATKGPITFRAGRTIYQLTVNARQDSILEDKNEIFIVNATAPSVPSNMPYCDTTVYIVDDDGRLLTILLR